MSGGYTLGSIRGTIAIDYDGAGVLRADRDVQGLRRTGEGTQASLDKTSRSMAVGGAVIAGGFAVAFNAAANFEKGLSAIQAVSGATTAELETVRAKALQLGQDTAFSATDAASAMEELVKAGISVKDVLGGAADATVALAAAGGISLPEAATIASNAMNQFGLAAKDMPNIANLIAGAANSSAIDVGDFGQSMSQAGAIAHLVGLSFEDTAASIALMGNAGIKGSDAGTSLKTMLSNLQPTTKQQQTLFDELGITTNGLGNKFFDAQGKIQGMASIAQTLQNATGKMTSAQKQMTLETIFGSDAIRAAAVVTGAGAKGFEDMASSMGKVSAADVAATRLNNVSGQMEQLKGSAETLGIQIGTMLIPHVNGLVKNATDLVNWFSNLSSGWQTTIVAFGGGTASILLVGAAFIKVIEMVKSFQAAVEVVKAWTIWTKISAQATKVWAGVQAAFNAIMALNPIVLIVLAVIALIAIIAILWFKSSAFRDFFIGIWNAIWGFLKTIGAWFAGPFAGFFVSLWNILVGVFNNIKSVVMTVFNFIISLVVGYFNIWKSIFNFFAPVISAVFNLIVAVIKTAWAIIAAIFAVAATIWDATVGAALRALWSLVVLVFNAWWNIISTVMSAIWGVLSAVWGAIWGFLVGVWNGISSAVSSVWNGMVAIISGVLQTWWSIISTVASAIWDFLTGVWNGISAVTSSVWNLISKGIEVVWNFIIGIIRGAVQTISNVINGISAIVGKIGQFFGQLKGAAEGGVGSLLSFVGGIPGKILSALGDIGSILLDSGRKIVQGLIDGITGMAGKVKDAIGNVLSAARNLLPFSPAKEGPFSGKGWTLYSGMSMMDGLAEGIVRSSKMPIDAFMGAVGGVHTTMVGSSAGGTSQTSIGGATTTYAPNVNVYVPAAITDPDQIGRYTAKRVQTALATSTSSSALGGRRS